MGDIRIGYACINTKLPSPNRTFRLRNATPDRILEVARYNLQALENILAWNAAHKIFVFRISSETIPFGSHPINDLPWWEILRPELARVAGLIDQHQMRVSMHPGQFSVLNSPWPEVVEATVAELDYHGRFLDALGLGTQHKIILHTGGSYGDKASAMARFVENFALLPHRAAGRLVLENDEKSYTVEEVLEVASAVHSPVVFDVFHHRWNPSLVSSTLREIIQRCGETWSEQDGRQKVHYSDQWEGKPPGSHSETVDISAFQQFFEQVRDLPLDIMLEVKDKQESVLAVHKAFPELALPPS